MLYLKPKLNYYSMKDLKELVRIVRKYDIKKFETLFNLAPEHREDNRYTDICHAILNGEITNDAEASQYLYGEPPGEAFRFFKHSLRNKLLGTLGFIDYNKIDHSEYSKAEFKCSQIRNQIFTLVNLYGRTTAIKQCEKLMAIAEKYQLSEYMAYALLILCRYAAFTGPKNRFLKYQKLYMKWNAQDMAERKARMYLAEIRIEFVGSSASKPEMAKIAFKYASEIEEDLEIYPDSYILKYNWFYLIGHAYEINFEYKKCIAVWQNFEEYLNAHPLFYNETTLGQIVVQQMVNYLFIKEYVNGKRCAERCLHYFKKGSTNSLIFLENYFLVCIQSGDYIGAVEILKMATNDVTIEEMPKANREKWILYLGYIHYINLVFEGEFSLMQTNISLSKFLNEFDVLNHDKEGYNVAIVIIETCIMIHILDHTAEGISKLVEKLITLKTYQKRYLIKDKDYRVQAFIKFLLLCDEHNYDHDIISHKSKDLFRKLQAAPLINTNTYEGLETVPLDIMWNFVMKDIKKGLLKGLRDKEIREKEIGIRDKEQGVRIAKRKSGKIAA
jgi:hypothetical protein